ncbi:50S ribosomal protein L25/general stress protein Ctc [Taklimakanibacter albus]|uniref:50S ribosomal protein L25/general stress protein Ctc n=1 Tax=Taklimakanibacter albus TaxID=2800327 RepID=A0ACC5R478_9HYPH|nr:50S ribosomal protein L25/general stress protein Ctc [Aestuariivirga sp. YIM B02566]MBK1867469.1 50S ribosomal protein L25/general stress protein Ctc [Aestuariivirga sp. YIM B02566]
MSKIIKLQATARGGAGKGAARAVRREGRVPGVVYGDKKEPQNISFAYNELQPHVNTGRFMSTLVDLEVDGTVVRAIPRDIQFEPVRDFISHVDFLRLGKGARIHVEIPVHFKNHLDSPGIKKGGVLNIVRHEIDLYCPADFIPDEILIDLTGLEIGQSIHISAVKLPENVTPAIRERDFTIATIAAPAGLKEEEAAAAEAPAAEVPATAQKAPPAAPGAAPAAGKDAKAGAAPAGKAAAAAPAAKAGDKKK